MHKMWVDEQPHGKNDINVLFNRRFELKNGLAWRLNQPDDNSEPKLEVISEDLDKIDILTTSLRHAGVIDDRALGAMQTQLRIMAASQQPESTMRL